MKRKKVFVDNRRRDILKAIIDSPKISVNELAQRFHISPITIRRDMQFLEDQNLITRFYGGATPTSEARETIDDNLVSKYRRLISEYAASLVEDNDSLFINTSMTALDMVRHIKSDNVTVITNNGFAIHKETPPGVNVFLTGGEIRQPKEALVGEFAERNLLSVNAKKAFIGCSGLSFEDGMTTENANEVKLNELMLTRAGSEAYILADHTKIGKSSSFKTCDIGIVTHIITDELAPKEEIERFKEQGIIVHQVKDTESIN